MKKGDLLFVYGSLRQGETADLSLRSGASLIGIDRINGSLFAVSWFPGVKTDGNDFHTDGPTVTGEVYELTDPALIRHLDNYEGYPSLFDRHQVETENSRTVWVYTYNGDVGENQRVLSGDWLNQKEAA